jgi:hypothetical protein
MLKASILETKKEKSKNVQRILVVKCVQSLYFEDEKKEKCKNVQRILVVKSAESLYFEDDKKRWVGNFKINPSTRITVGIK